ncbi:MAG: hypothetical protein M3M96_09435 [Candidatus Eremiobacteraeota bacterium]|nr:hypothetical protein [Candidatus Eremiobacteraeota bacterium]
MRSSFAVFTLALAVLMWGVASGARASVESSAFSSLEFRNIGPLSGRIDTIAGVPGDPNVYYAGGLGGLFKTVDGGVSWESVFEHKPVSSVNAIAVAPSDSNVVYAGTGEANLRNDIAFGDGVWRSGDAGKTWQHAGLEGTGHISAIAVDSGNANDIYVAALGDAYSATKDRGIYHSVDGGKTWSLVLYADDRTGASSVAIDPKNSHHILAGMWEGWRTPYHLNSGGPNDGLYESNDAGNTWTRLVGHGLPEGTQGRIAVAFSRGNPLRVYALIESREGSLWRSDDGGRQWKMVNASHGINQRPFYFTSLAVDPQNQDHVYFMSVQLWQSMNAGVTATHVPNSRGGDFHTMWIDPRNANRLATAFDGGVNISTDGGKTWLQTPLVVSQSYHVSTDDRVPYTVCSENQDSGSACGPSNSLMSGGIPAALWFSAGGGESGWIVIDAKDSNIIYGDGYEGEITRFDRRTSQARVVDVWPVEGMGHGAKDLRYRFQWTSPLALSPHVPGRIYMGGNRIFRSDTGGQSWRAISPDLTRNDKSKQDISGGPITHDSTSVEYYDTVFSIAESPVRAGQIWAGTDDGYAWLTRDGGRHWTNTIAGAGSIAPFGRVDYIHPSAFDAATAYMVLDYHKSGDRSPHIFKTSDFGRHWKSIVADLPPDSYARMVKEDPFRRGLLYVGTETALWVSFDDGGHWVSLQNNLPTVPVYDFTVQKRFDDLVVSTHGRAMWILDDISPLQRLNDRVLSSSAYLFAPRDAYRFRLGDFAGRGGWAGTNPKYGADLNLYLKNDPGNRPIAVKIYQGRSLVRTLEVKKAHAGINRLWWDLQYEDLKPFDDYKPWGSGGFDGPLVLPGRYDVRVTTDGITQTQPLVVKLDPRSHATLADLRAQLAFIQRVRADESLLTARIAALQKRRAQAIAGKQSALSSEIDDALHRIYEPEVTEGEDALRYPVHLYARLSGVAGKAASADAAPTDSEKAVLRVLEEEMKREMARSAALLSVP